MKGMPRLLAAAALATALPASAQDVQAWSLVQRLASLGPRTPGSAAHGEAQEVLLAAMTEAGLVDVAHRSAGAAGTNLEGILPGSDAGTAGEIVLAAHYDTVPGSPGALDDASGCAVALAAAAELARTPRSRTLRVVLFDGEERDLAGSRAWAGGLAGAERDRILAALVLEMLGRGSRGVVLDLPAGGGSERPPAWLVHAALRAGAATAFPLFSTSPRASMPMQLVARTTRSSYDSDGSPLAAAGIPTALLSDFSMLRPDAQHHRPGDLPERLDAERLAGWATAVAALCRRLDALAGRPVDEQEYLVALGRVWIRRDLVWIGFLPWVALVFAGRPGRWAGAAAEERRERGRRYLPGFVYRIGLLFATLWFPAVAVPLLVPSALLELATRAGLARRWAEPAALLPAAVWLSLLFWARTTGVVTAYALPLTQTLLLATVLASFVWQSRVAARSTPA